MSVYADLHAHTTTSDGEMELSDVPAVAADADVDVVAITDHDRVHPELAQPVTTHDGVTIIRGIELRVWVEELGEKVDLLGYGVSETPALTAEIERIQADRVERGQKIIDCLEGELGVELGIEGREGIGRPHIARAVASHPELNYEYRQTFEELIGRDCPCYVSREVTAFEQGVELLRDACALVGLAHPYRYDNPEGALKLTKHLDAVERHYPYGFEVDATAVDRVVAEHDLVVAGGTDAHTHELGVQGLTEAEYQTFSEATGLFE